jgi:hypothetical protein
MRSPILQTSLLLFSFAWTGNSQDSLAVVKEWLPLAVGDRWIYEYEKRDGNRQKPDIARWNLAEAITGIETVPEGVLIKRRISYLNNTAPPPGWRRQEESDILVRDKCLYYLEYNAWGGGSGPLNAEFRGYLAKREALPDVCFPLSGGKTWGNPNPAEGRGRDKWWVSGRGRENVVDDPASITPESWRLEAHLASGDDNYIWFQKGLGITGARTFHNGTYSDLRQRLLRFEPANTGR